MLPAAQYHSSTRAGDHRFGGCCAQIGFEPSRYDQWLQLSLPHTGQRSPCSQDNRWSCCKGSSRQRRRETKALEYSHSTKITIKQIQGKPTVLIYSYH